MDKLAQDGIENAVASVAESGDARVLQAVLDGIEDIIYIADMDDHTLLFVNNEFRRLFGDDGVGKKCYQMLQGRDSPCPFCTNDQIRGEYSGHSYVWEFQNELTKRWFRCADKAIPWLDGRLVRFEIAADITELKTLAERLERSNRELQQFAYVASHDLQEPLRMVRSFTELLAKKYSDILDDKGREFMEYIVDGASRMQGLINDLLTFSRVETQGVAPEPVDSGQVLQSVLQLMQTTIVEREAQITHGTLPEVQADANQLSRVFLNLIGNAIKFSRDNPEVTISAEKKGSDWIFSVQDNGIGISDQYQQRIFQIFKRLHAKDEYEGSGIGLAVTKRIIERHGGAIWLESTPGKGTIFYFTLPGVAKD